MANIAGARLCTTPQRREGKTAQAMLDQGIATGCSYITGGPAQKINRVPLTSWGIHRKQGMFGGSKAQVAKRFEPFGPLEQQACLAFVFAQSGQYPIQPWRSQQRRNSRRFDLRMRAQLQRGLAASRNVCRNFG
jgi:hypothetical protein